MTEENDYRVMRTSPLSKHAFSFFDPGQKCREQKMRGLRDFSIDFTAEEKTAADFLAWKIWEGRRTNGLDYWLYGRNSICDAVPRVTLTIPREEITREIVAGMDLLTHKRWFDDDRKNDPQRYYRIVCWYELPLRQESEKVVTVHPGPLLVVEARRRYFLREDHEND